MDIEKMKEFLLKAESETYLAGDKGKIWKLDPSLNLSGETVYEYGFAAEGGNPACCYYDRYFGQNQFSGQEIILKDVNVPIWSRVYYGLVSPSEKHSDEEIMKFVRKARLNLLLKMWEESSQCYYFQLSPWSFCIIPQGSPPWTISLNNFHYKEVALHGDTVAYKRICVGGLLD